MLPMVEASVTVPLSARLNQYPVFIQLQRQMAEGTKSRLCSFLNAEGGGGGSPESGHVSEQEALSGLCVTDS